MLINNFFVKNATFLHITRLNRKKNRVRKQLEICGKSTALGLQNHAKMKTIGLLAPEILALFHDTYFAFSGYIRYTEVISTDDDAH